MRIIVINLDEDTKRRRYVEERLLELGLRWERLSAIDGNRLTPSHEALVDRDAQIALGLRISPGEIGCWISHRLAHQMIADGSENMALIMEDDVQIQEDLPEVLSLIGHGAAGFFDVVYLHRCKLHRKYIPVLRLDALRTIGFVRPVDSGALAYLMTREAANHFIQQNPRMIYLADHTLYQHWVHGLVVCSIDPPVVFHRDEGHSSIAARPVHHPTSTDPRQWLRRKWHQLRKKYVRRIAFHKALHLASRTGCLSGLPRPSARGPFDSGQCRDDEPQKPHESEYSKSVP